jgi:hypothetical protein
MHARTVRFSAAALSLLTLVPALAYRETVSTVTPLFDLSSPDRSPFPSDRFTAPDPDQNTARRVNLPMPGDCPTNASECEDLAVLNQFDGFNLEARMSVPFDGEIDPASVTPSTVFLLNLGDALARRAAIREGGDESFNPAALQLPPDALVRINHIVWDPATRELSFRPDVSLDEHTTYALVVTTGVRDATGRAIGVADAFRQYRQALAHDDDRYYRRALLTAEWAIRRVSQQRIEAAAVSVFTTQTFSHVVARMRDAIREAPAPALNFAVGPGGARAVFGAAQIQTLTTNAQITVAGPLTPQPLAQPLINMRAIPGAVGTLAFGTFRTLDFTARPAGHIPPFPTRTGTLAATGSMEVAFNLWLPAGTMPAQGWPIAIYGHGSFGDKNGAFQHAAILNSHGVAVLAINAHGRGRGPLTTMTVRRTDGTSMTFAAPGLGYDADGDGTIEVWEPMRAPRPQALLNTSGSIAQAAAQHIALVRGIQAGVDVDGDGTTDLDASRIYYLGQSMGVNWGMMAFAFEPAIRAAVFNVPSGTLFYNTALSPQLRSGLADMLASRVPSLLNSADGLTSVDGIAIPAPHFNENLPLRNQPPLVNTVPGAIAIQRMMDRVVWAAQIANNVAFAPLLRRSPPDGVAPRPFVLQAARSDQSSVNPGTADLLRSGRFEDRLMFYRHDLNFGNPGVFANPHPFLGQVSAVPALKDVAFGAQHQIGTFFESDGAIVIHPSPVHLWEVPVLPPFPNDTFYLPR